MASINKIKELADAHEYSLAAPILDSQDLEKSYNAQFLRLCGEIYENVGRLKDARHMYVKAHVLAPEATQIIFSLIEFYLKRGYFELAERYFEEYIEYCSGRGRELSNVRYIMKKAKLPDFIELYDMLFPYYRDNMDEKWSFELLMLTKLIDKSDLDVIASDYKATFKNGLYTHLVDEVVDNKAAAWDNFFVYAENEVPDDDPDQQEIRDMEQEQLKADYLKLNPPEEEEAVITEMVSVEEKGSGEGGLKEGLKNVKKVENVEKGLKNFIKKRFKKIQDEDLEGEENESEEDSDDENDVEGVVASAEEIETAGATDATPKAEESTESAPAGPDASILGGSAENAGDSATDAENGEADKEANIEANTEANTEANADSNAESDAETNEKEEFVQDFVTYEFDDGFAPESDTIAGLEDIDDEFEDSTEEAFSAFRDYVQYQDSDQVVESFVPDEEADGEEYVPEEDVSEEDISVAETVEEEFVPEVEEFVPEVAEEPETTPVFEKAVEEPVDTPVFEKTVEEPVDTPVFEKTVEEPVVTPVEEEFIPEVEEYVPEVEEEPETTPVFEKTVEEPVATPVFEKTVEEPVVTPVEEEFVPEVEEFVPEVEEEPETTPVFEKAVEEPVATPVFEKTVEEPVVTPVVEEPEFTTVPEEPVAFTPIAEEEFVPGVEESLEELEEANEGFNTIPEPVYEKVEPYIAPEPEVTPEPVYTVEPEVTPEPVYTAEPEVTPEPVYTAEPEVTPEPVYTAESEVAPETAFAPESGVVEEPVASSDNLPVPAYMKDDIPAIDFTQFSSDLFPGLNTVDAGSAVVENKFNKVIETEGEKLDEGLKEEEAKLREAEALLASLGIKL